jgi:hypothetical protein
MSKNRWYMATTGSCIDHDCAQYVLIQLSPVIAKLFHGLRAAYTAAESVLPSVVAVEANAWISDIKFFDHVVDDIDVPLSEDWELLPHEFDVSCIEEDESRMETIAARMGCSEYMYIVGRPKHLDYEVESPLISIQMVGDLLTALAMQGEE